MILSRKTFRIAIAMGCFSLLLGYVWYASHNEKPQLKSSSMLRQIAVAALLQSQSSQMLPATSSIATAAGLKAHFPASLPTRFIEEPPYPGLRLSPALRPYGDLNTEDATAFETGSAFRRARSADSTSVGAAFYHLLKSTDLTAEALLAPATQPSYRIPEESMSDTVHRNP